MSIEDNKKQKLAKLLLGLSKDDIQEIIKEQARISSEKNLARNQRELTRLQKREAALAAELEEIRNKIADIQGGKDVRGSRGKGNVSGRPIEELVIDVLREKGQPARPKDVRDSILNKGWYEGNPVSLQTSVAIALSSLVKAGKVTKNENKHYSAV